MLKISLATTGRCLLALYFLLPGVLKFVEWDRHVGLMEMHGMVFIPVFLAAAGALQILCSVGIIFNRYTQWLTLMLAFMVLVINFQLHDFWNYTDTQGAHEMQNFVKNLGIFAGLLVLSAYYWKDDQAVAKD
jgi:putative oxidoreductase